MVCSHGFPFKTLSFPVCPTVLLSSQCFHGCPLLAAVLSLLYSPGLSGHRVDVISYVRLVNADNYTFLNYYTHTLSYFYIPILNSCSISKIVRGCSTSYLPHFIFLKTHLMTLLNKIITLILIGWPFLPIVFLFISDYEKIITVSVLPVYIFHK
jgi:hypothetical protein